LLSIELLLTNTSQGDIRALARAITLVENEVPGYKNILQNLQNHQSPIIGFTGPPGAGKSTLINELISHLTKEKNKRIAVVAVDPTSPIHFGSILGDRIRMIEHHDNPNVYIRSLATRGSLGGLSVKTLEITDVLRHANFDYIFIETVGVGQSEVEVAGLADCTVVLLVPESGDEVQAIKAGLMEIADIFIVNKADRPDSQQFIRNLKAICSEKHGEWTTQVVPAVATKKEGIEESWNAIQTYLKQGFSNKRKKYLLAEKAWRLIQNERMKSIDKNELYREISEKSEDTDFNIYSFVESFSETH